MTLLMIQCVVEPLLSWPQRVPVELVVAARTPVVVEAAVLAPATLGLRVLANAPEN